jgi:hypothetical protein
MKVYSREMACPRDARLEVYAHETHAYEIHALRMLARKVLGDLRVSHLTNGGAVLELSRFELQNNDFPRQETKVSSGRRSLGAGPSRPGSTGPSVLTKRSLLAGLSFFKFGTVSLLPFPTSQMQQYEKLAPDNSRCRGRLSVFAFVSGGNVGLPSLILQVGCLHSTLPSHLPFREDDLPPVLKSMFTYFLASFYALHCYHHCKRADHKLIAC